MTRPNFPCERLPQDPSAGRLLGLYPQRQEGLWMQRVRIAGGRLSGAQWQALAAISSRLAKGCPLHLTTRQDIELHDLSQDAVPAVQSAMAEAGLTGQGGCGDTLRNVTVCACSGVVADTPDLLPLAEQITQWLWRDETIFALPRKFKVSLSGCAQACTMPWINDIGLVAERDGQSWAFRASVAGSLGTTPSLAIAWPERLHADDVLPFVQAAVLVFAEHGDREHRTRARLRHVRERLGDAAFVELLSARFQQQRRCGEAPPVRLTTSTTRAHRRRLTVPAGNVPVEVAERLGALATTTDLQVMVGCRHDLWLSASQASVVAEAVAICPDAWRSGVTIIACPGVRWCKRAITDSQAMAEEIRQAMADSTSTLFIAVSGCPNGCAHSAVADVGLIGRRVRTEQGSVDGYRAWIGGNGCDRPELGRQHPNDLAASDVAAFVRAQSDRVRESGYAREFTG